MNFDRPCRNKVQFQAVCLELYLKLAAFLFVEHFLADCLLEFFRKKPTAFQNRPTSTSNSLLSLFSHWTTCVTIWQKEKT